MGSAVLGEAISAIRDWSTTEGKGSRAGHADKTFGSLVFNDEVQQKRLPAPVYHALRRTITHGESLDVSVADAIATAMKQNSIIRNLPCWIRYVRQVWKMISATLSIDWWAGRFFRWR